MNIFWLLSLLDVHKQAKQPNLMGITKNSINKKNYAYENEHF